MPRRCNGDHERAMYSNTVPWPMHVHWAMATLANNNVVLNQYDVQGLENTKSMTQSSMQCVSNASIQLYNIDHHHPGKNTIGT